MTVKSITPTLVLEDEGGRTITLHHSAAESAALLLNARGAAVSQAEGKRHGLDLEAECERLRRNHYLPIERPEGQYAWAAQARIISANGVSVSVESVSYWAEKYHHVRQMKRDATDRSPHTAVTAITVSDAYDRYLSYSGEKAQALWILIDRRNKGVTGVEAREMGVDIEHISFQLRRHDGFDVDRGAGRYTLKTPLNVAHLENLPDHSKEVQLFWANKMKVARAAVEEERQAEAERPRPTAVVKGPDGKRRTFYGETARLVYELKFDAPNSQELTPDAIAQLGDLVRKATWCGHAHRIYGLAPGVKVVETENCDPTSIRRLKLAEAHF